MSTERRPDQLVLQEQIAKTETITIRELVALNSTAKLNLKPAFQRNKVWSKEAKAYLIDTIMRGLPVPEIFAYGSGEAVLSIIDGQQRLSAILEFISGELNLWVDNKVYGFEDFDIVEQQKFSSYELTFRVIQSRDSFLIRDLFQRLNKYTVVLNAQEIRHAVSESSLVRLAESLALDSFWRSSGLFTKQGRQRMKDIERCLELLLALEFGPIDPGRVAIDLALRRHDEAKLAAIEKSFRQTLFIVKSVLGNQTFAHRFSWGDFYPFFMAVSQLAPLKLSSEKAEALRSTLLAFRRETRSENAKGLALQYQKGLIYGTHGKERRSKVEIFLTLLRRELK